MEGDKNTYIMSSSLSDLDMLPVNEFKKNDKVIPLWTNMTSRRKNYYKLEIMATGQHLYDNISNIKKYKCHVCNIYVPTIYMKEHNASKKHKVCMKIIDIALARVREHTKEEYKDCGTYKSPEAYFCEACATVVLTQQRANHERTINHINSSHCDEMLNDLLLVYMNNDTTKKEYDELKEMIDDDENSVTEAVKENDDNENDDFMLLNEESELNNKSECESLHSMTSNKGNELKIIENDVEMKTNGEEKSKTILELKEYFNNLPTGCKNPMHKINILDDSFMEITAINGSILKVPINNYLGYHYNGKHVICRVCMMMVYDLKAHSATKKHKKLIIPPIRDTHCVRQLDHIWDHCVLCNEITVDKKLHISTNEHKERLESSIISKQNIASYSEVASNGNNIVENKPANIKSKIGNAESKDSGSDNDDNEETHFHCDICNITLTVDETKLHKKSMKHKSKVTENRIFQNKENYHYLLKKSDTDPLCRVCNIAVTDNHEHFLTLNHKDNYKKVLKDNTIRAMDKDRYYCEICNSIMFITYELQHISGKKHKNQMKKKISDVEIPKSTEKPTTPIVESNDVFDLLCQMDLTNNEDTDYFCYICKIKIPNNSADVQNHIDSASHKQCKKAANENLIHDTKLIKINYQFKRTASNELCCTVCKVTVNCTQKSMNEHIESDHHKEMYSQLLKSNKISRNIDNRYFCNYCKVPITNCNEIDHILGNRHKANVNIHNELEIDDSSESVAISENSYINTKRIRTRTRRKRKTNLNSFLEDFDDL